ncbi:MAG: 30S ribosomal protein S2 [Chloroflexi bacterium]|jgi:small subunit ribosomal protein S2|nr:30S ribosomal protein S2 [Chloroflexota bacterium]
MAEIVSVRELLEAGAHFGHQVSYWHPKMKGFIFTQRNGIHIIDLEKTVVMLQKACDFVRDLVGSGQAIVFVGTKRQAQQIVEEEAKRCGMCYVNQRWIGGTLTNFATIQTRIDYLVRLEEKKDKGEFDYLSKKERAKLEREIFRLNKRLGSLKEMTSLPGALFIVDPIKDKIALVEARNTGIPVVSIADTNCNPVNIDYPIPANDDAIKAIKLVCSKMADAVLEGKAIEETSHAAVVEVPAELEAGLEITGSYVFAPEED